MMTDEDRRRAVDLMRNALALLDDLGEQRATLHLQLALDLLDDDPALIWLGGLPTCH
jgi:hypothetical protein